MKEKKKVISADRLKADLEKKFGHTDTVKALVQLIDEQPPASTADDWTPMADRPPENGWWLWSADGGAVEKDFYWDGHWIRAEEHGYNVLAWMPVPGSYKESAKDA